MDRDQINQADMQNTVAAYMDNNNSIWGAVKAMTGTVSELKTNNREIARLAGEQQAPTTGVAEEKLQVRLDFQDKILEVADQLAALADKTKDANLGAQAELNLSALDKMDVDLLEETGKRIAELAAARLAALADYGIAQADVTELDGLKTRFHGVKNAVRTAIADRSGKTRTIPQLLSANRSLLRNQLDKQMTRFKKSQPEFYAGHRSARVIVDRGGSGGGTQPPPAPTPKPPQ